MLKLKEIRAVHAHVIPLDENSDIVVKYNKGIDVLVMGELYPCPTIDVANRLIKKTLKDFKAFKDWFQSDAVWFHNGVYRTQCAQYQNKLNYVELFQYFCKEYCG